MDNAIINGTITQSSGISGTVDQKEQMSGVISPSIDLEGNIMATVLKGLSAYELAVLHGYTGTEEEWLEYIRGKSAYELAVIHGFEGTEEEWINSLNATIELGEVTTGSEASIRNSGDNRHAVFDFVLPTESINSLSQEDTVILYCGNATEVV